MKHTTAIICFMVSSVKWDTGPNREAAAGECRPFV
jgi:hypothetical protein